MVGAKIGEGRVAEVYEWGPDRDRVVKLYQPGYPPDWIRYEAKVGSAVQAAGVPAPGVFELVEVDERQGLLFERMPGKMLREWMLESPDEWRRFATEMAGLHYSIHRCTAAGLPRQKDRLAGAIKQSEELLKERLNPVLRCLDALPEGDRVCHGDFHPDNILYTGVSSVAIDWVDASTGNPLGDVARTSLMFLSPYVPPGTPEGITGTLIQEMKQQLNRVYLDEYYRLAGVDENDCKAWLLPVAAARLRENVPGERPWLLELIDDQLR